LKSRFFLCLIITFFELSTYSLANYNDHEKAIEAVKSGEILPLAQILESIQEKFDGRILAINLKDSEKGLFGWVYDIRMIDENNKVINLRVDAGTSTVLLIEGGAK